MHGDRDDVVPINQSELLEAALQKAGVSVTCQVVRGAGHGFRNPEERRTVEAFFDEHLRK